jgi:hypothetical protein
MRLGIGTPSIGVGLLRMSWIQNGRNAALILLSLVAVSAYSVSAMVVIEAVLAFAHSFT